jgi:mannose-6-phosphate isomerase-like protein (cupin superfamily)
MARRGQEPLVVLAALLALAAPIGAEQGSSGATMVVPADLKWVETPGRPGAWQAVVEGDPKVGPSHFFLKYAQNFDGGPHHHTSDHGGYVLSGTVLLTVDGKETRLPPGSFFWIKGMRTHSVRCERECIQAIDVRGGWDAIPDRAADSSGRPFDSLRPRRSSTAAGRGR